MCCINTLQHAAFNFSVRHLAMEQQAKDGRGELVKLRKLSISALLYLAIINGQRTARASALLSISSLVGSLHFPLILHPWYLRMLRISALLTGLHGKAKKIELFLTGLSWQDGTQFCGGKLLH